MKKIISLTLCVSLIGCAAPYAKKEGVALGFQRVKTSDPAFLQSNLGAKPKPSAPGGAGASEQAVESSAGGPSPLVVGAVVGGATSGSITAVSTGKVVVGTLATPVLLVAAVGAAAGAATAALISALMPETDCGDGWALFTLKTAEGEIKTIRQPRSFVCKYKSGDIVRYYEDDTGIAVRPN
jgi:hypothetical protein